MVAWILQFGIPQLQCLGLGVGESLSLSPWFRNLIAFLCFYFFITFFWGEHRVCPGRHFADKSLYVAVSNILAVYNIKPPTDDEGNEVKLRGEVTGGMISSVDLIISELLFD